jgi:hypothetical protein
VRYRRRSGSSSQRLTGARGLAACIAQRRSTYSCLMILCPRRGQIVELNLWKPQAAMELRLAGAPGSNGKVPFYTRRKSESPPKSRTHTRRTSNLCKRGGDKASVDRKTMRMSVKDTAADGMIGVWMDAQQTSAICVRTVKHTTRPEAQRHTTHLRHEDGGRECRPRVCTRCEDHMRGYLRTLRHAARIVRGLVSVVIVERCDEARAMPEYTVGVGRGMSDVQCEVIYTMKQSLCVFVCDLRLSLWG